MGHKRCASSGLGLPLALSGTPEPVAFPLPSPLPQETKQSNINPSTGKEHKLPRYTRETKAYNAFDFRVNFR